jgi:hypothetical protein
MQTGERTPAISRTDLGETMKSLNHIAVLVAAILFFALGAVWYNVFSQPWLDGIGKTVEQLMKDNGGSPAPYVIGFLAILVMCYTLGWIVQRGMEPTAGNGALTGATVAFGLVGGMLALNYGFEARGITLWLINAGYALVGLVLAGAIIGGWKKKPRTE